jgi:hypothetical protein
MERLIKILLVATVVYIPVIMTVVVLQMIHPEWLVTMFVPFAALAVVAVLDD